MHQFLGLEQNLKLGLTLIVTPEWMFLATIANPYHLETNLQVPGHDKEQGTPMYLDGFAYCGLLNIQDMQQTWPATANKGVDFMQHSALSSLEKQSCWE
jgi:hypothetical protein